MLRAFPISLTEAASRWLRNQPSGSITIWEGAIPSKTAADAKIAIQEMDEHEENLKIIKEIRASTDATIRNQGASIKTLEIQIGQISKVLQERGFGSLPNSTETNPQDQVKLISTAKADFSGIRHIGCGPYAISGTQHRSILSKTVPFSKSTTKLQL
ncbi:hypothetical protein Tco_0231987 [Tanacetum coccineum]